MLAFRSLQHGPVSMEPSRSPPLFNIAHIGKAKRSARREITPACISANEKINPLSQEPLIG
jgi:hypothetical protein